MREIEQAAMDGVLPTGFSLHAVRRCDAPVRPLLRVSREGASVAPGMV